MGAFEILERLLGVPAKTSSKMLYAEFGRLPLRCMWLQQSMAYLGRLMQMDGQRLCKAAFEVDRRRGLGWHAKLLQELRQSFDIRLPSRSSDCDFVQVNRAIKDAYILKTMSAEAGNHLQQAYYSFKTEFRLEPYISEAKNKHLRRDVAMFRLGTHWLQVNKGRFIRQPYERRHCRCCKGEIDTEAHAIFYCRENDELRKRFVDLFQLRQPRNLRSFLVHNKPHRLALFLTACKAIKSQPLCVAPHDEVDVDIGIELGIDDMDAYDSD